MYFNTTPSGEIIYTGQDYPELGIKSGENLTNVLTNVLGKVQSMLGDHAKVQELDEKVTHLNSGEIASDAATFGLDSGSSTCISQIVTRSFTYSVSSSGLFSYDLSAAKAALPTGFSFQSVKVSAPGSSSTSTINSFTLKSLPTTVQVDVIVNSPCGVIGLSKSLYIVSNTEGTAILNPKQIDATQPSQLSQKAFDELLSATVARLQARVDDLESLSIGNAIAKANGDITTQTETLETLQSTLSEEIASLKSTAESLQSQSNILNQRITDLETAV